MVSSSIQFRGVESVLEAFQNRDVPAWSLWQGKQFMFKCESADMLESFAQLEKVLQTLAGASNAIYTIKVYEDLGKGVKIKSNTADDGSFNFKLNLEGQEITQGQYGALRNQGQIENRLGAIEKLLIKQAEEEEAEEEEEPRSRLGIIGDILNDPGLSAIVVPLITKALGLGNVQQTAPHMMPIAINGVQEDEQLNTAIQILQSADTKLSEHLMKLAALSQNDRTSFDFLLKTLDNL